MGWSWRSCDYEHGDKQGKGRCHALVQVRTGQSLKYVENLSPSSVAEVTTSFRGFSLGGGCMCFGGACGREQHSVEEQHSVDHLSITLLMQHTEKIRI